jgi:hypothetical protein
LGRKTNQAVYEDPFDLAAGGASLTRASKEGRIFANPALMPYGGKFHRWGGATFSLLVNKDSIDTGRELFNAARAGDSAAADDPEQEDANREFVDKVFERPVRVGWGFALSWVTNNFGLSVFSRFEPDIAASHYGDTGLPEVRFRAESYHGAALGVGLRTPLRWLAFGVTGKYLYVAEPDLTVAVTDQEQIASFRDPEVIQDLAKHNKGMGFDLGALAFAQGNTVDYSLAAKVDDIGDTKLTGDSETPTQLEQVVSVGTGVTLHTGADALHLAADYRDILNAYEEETFKKVYVGAKLLLRTYVGFAAGYYNGYPSYGAEVDLILCRVAATYYTRELGDHPGVDPRRIYMASLSLGF